MAATPAANGRNSATVQSIDRAVQILNVLCEAETPLSLAAISTRVGLRKSTTYRLLRTLGQHSLVAQDPLSKSYAPGFRIFEWSSAVTRKLDLREQALPELRELSERTEETVHLAILDQGDVIYIDKQESRHAIRMYSAIGRRAPAYCTAVGKVLLAHLAPAQLDAVLAVRKLERRTPNTITSRRALKQELALTRARGYALDQAEHEPNIYCVACPIFNQHGQVIAAMSLTVPSLRLPREGIATFAPLVQTYALRISRKMGYVPPQGTVA